MKDPNTQLSELLRIYSDRVLQLDMAFYMLNYLNEASKDQRKEVLDKVPGFFVPVGTSLLGFVILELSKLFAEREDRSLSYFLGQVDTHFKSINFKRNDVLSREAVQNYAAQINELQSLINKFLHQRDKYYAHADGKYFGKEQNLGAEAPISIKEVKSLIDLAKEIVFIHYSAFFDTHLEMEIVGRDDIDRLISVLQRYSGWLKDPEIAELIRRKEAKGH